VRLLSSSTFKFTLLYVAIFAVSVACVLGFVYSATIDDIEGNIKNVINSQIGKIRAEFVKTGEDGAVYAITEIMQEDFDRMSFFMLIDPNWRVIAGNVETWPGGSEGRWITFIPKVQRETGTYWVPALARTVTLPDKHLLMVGYNLWHIQKLKSGAMRIMYFTTAIILFVGMIGGIFITNIVKRRVEKLNAVCQKVMSGKLKERVQVSGSGDEFDMLGQNFNAMMTRIEELVDGIRTVSHNIAHDLRTPITRIRNKLEKLSANIADPAESSETIKKIITDIDGLVATFNSILSISEVESGAGSGIFGEFNLSETLRDVCDFYSLLAEEKNITMQINIADNIIMTGDRHLISQVAANLIDNAIKYTPENGVVIISLRSEKGKNIMIFSDSGPGIPLEFREKVKERFFRLERSRTTKGTGLGLSLVDAVVKFHNGTFEISSNEENGGMVAQITL